MKIVSLIFAYVNGLRDSSPFRMRTDGTNLLIEHSADDGETYSTVNTVTSAGTTTTNGAVGAGLTGTAARFVGGTGSAAPDAGTWQVRDFCIGVDGKVYVCTVAGTPGTWVAV